MGDTAVALQKGAAAKIHYQQALATFRQIGHQTLLLLPQECLARLEQPTD